MASELVRELVESGVHFGHRSSRWNPKMQPYIYGKRNAIHIIDIRETVRGLLLAKKFVSAVVAKGQDLLFVGTKRQAREAIQKQAQRCAMPFVNERWLGGTLTNFRTIRSRLQRLEELEKLETTGSINQFSKKMVATLQRERRKIHRNLEGIRKMTRLPGALFVIDVKHEHIALREARKLGIPTICLIDTDGDPSWCDVTIPGNDDAMRAINLICQHVADAVEEGKRGRPPEGAPQAGGETYPGAGGAGGERPERGPRRPRRMTPTARFQQPEAAAPGGPDGTPDTESPGMPEGLEGSLGGAAPEPAGAAR